MPPSSSCSPSRPPQPPPDSLFPVSRSASTPQPLFCPTNPLRPSPPLQPPLASLSGKSLILLVVDCMSLCVLVEQDLLDHYQQFVEFQGLVVQHVLDLGECHE
ncbi:hypothetical protein ACH5RR_003838 [Cinchona calisaya]|uniref:Uncharacterized protein n=1 Tax=Cinchona calisaya TaxID=153742 RepID=A0ABD3AWM8_9GENT